MASTRMHKAKFADAVLAMQAIGITEAKTKKALKKLLKVYDRNWALIEDGNYRVLADSIFEEDEVVDHGKKPVCHDEENESEDESEQPLRRSLKRKLILENEESEGGTLLPAKAHPSKTVHRSEDLVLSSPGKSIAGLPGASSEENGTCEKSQLQPAIMSKHIMLSAGQGSSDANCSKEVTGYSNHLLLQKTDSVIPAMIEPKKEPFTFETPQAEVPIAVILPGDPSNERPTVAEADSCNSLPSQSAGGGNDKEVIPSSFGERVLSVDLRSMQEETSDMEIASSSTGDMKIRLSFEAKGMKAPSLDEVLKSVEDECLRSYKILDPNFSAAGFLNMFIECARKLGSNSADKTREDFSTVSVTSELFKDFSVREVSGVNAIKEGFCVPASACGIMNASVKNLEHAKESNALSLAVVPQIGVSPNVLIALNYIEDITKGEERVQIPWVNEVNDACPPRFFYTMQNLVFKCARVNFSLSQIRDERCCAICFDDCLVSSETCTCAKERQGNFVYTLEGCLSEEFLEECISMSRNPREGCFYCDECPIGRKNNDMEPCKGHLVKKFIRECWIKCGCSKRCGNRVVQRGITCKLQVFYTPEGKGWGLRTLEDLPKGAFVCEYVGEIITCEELQFRMVHNTNGLGNNYPVLLDAAWNTGVVDDEKALCLDSTSYGNVARFINHRCLDANL